MEIGSFIELDIRNGAEYHLDSPNLLRLNTARAGIYHATRLYGCSTIYVPYYQCPTVSDFLMRKEINIEYYRIDNKFEPVHLVQKENTAFLLVNYFGILSQEKINKIASRFKNVIIDNSAAFFMPPIVDYANVYSTRKFFGVPDGCYVIAPESERYIKEYSQDCSSDTAAFLLKRIEYGSSAVYSERMKNEERLDNSDIMLMSKLTNTLLSGIDYETIANKRRSNFDLAHSLYNEINLIDPTLFYSENNVPMVYPLVLTDKNMLEKLKDKQVYTGRWWHSVLKKVPLDSFEAFLSQYMLPIPIDQRYSEREILGVSKIVFSSLSN